MRFTSEKKKRQQLRESREAVIEDKRKIAIPRRFRIFFLFFLSAIAWITIISRATWDAKNGWNVSGTRWRYAAMNRGKTSIRHVYRDARSVLTFGLRNVAEITSYGDCARFSYNL